MTTNDVSCLEAMVGTCLSPQANDLAKLFFFFFKIATRDPANPYLASRRGGHTLPSVPRSSLSSRRLPADPVPSRGPAGWDSIFRPCATHPVAAIPFGERLSGSMQNILFNLE